MPVRPGVAQTLGNPHDYVFAAPGFEVTTVASGLDRPPAFAFLPDGRILIAEQSGLVRLVKDGVIVGQPVIDLRDKVNSRAERGLLDITIDPHFAANGYVYLFYTEDPPGQPQDGWEPRNGVVLGTPLAGRVS